MQHRAAVGPRRIWSALRRPFDGTGIRGGVGAVFVLFGMLFLLSILLTPGGWQWWLRATPVHGREVSGIVYYTYRGVSYTADDPDHYGTGPKTIFVIPSDPEHPDFTVTWVRVVDWSLTAGAAAVGAGFVLAGVRRRRNGERIRSGTGGGDFGSGIDSETVRRIVAQRNAPI